MKAAASANRPPGIVKANAAARSWRRPSPRSTSVTQGASRGLTGRATPAMSAAPRRREEVAMSPMLADTAVSSRAGAGARADDRLARHDVLVVRQAETDDGVGRQRAKLGAHLRILVEIFGQVLGVLVEADLDREAAEREHLVAVQVVFHLKGLP